MSNFKNDLATGKRGEELVAAALKSRGHNVVDVSDNITYQSKDIDFLLSNKTQSTTLEVKNDIRSVETGNVFIETHNINNYSRGGCGWYYYCEAEYLAFVQEKLNKAHIVSRNDIIDIVNSGTVPLRHSSETYGYCIPINVLSKCDSYTCLSI